MWLFCAACFGSLRKLHRSCLCCTVARKPTTMCLSLGSGRWNRAQVRNRMLPANRFLDHGRRCSLILFFRFFVVVFLFNLLCRYSTFCRMAEDLDIA